MFKRYSIWEDNEEQWNEEVANSPDVVVDALSVEHAGSIYMNSRGGWTDYGTLIIRDEETQQYTVTEMQRDWQSISEKPTTLEELCAE